MGGEVNLLCVFISCCTCDTVERMFSLVAKTRNPPKNMSPNIYCSCLTIRVYSICTYLVVMSHYWSNTKQPDAVEMKAWSFVECIWYLGFCCSAVLSLPSPPVCQSLQYRLQKFPTLFPYRSCPLWHYPDWNNMIYFSEFLIA